MNANFIYTGPDLCTEHGAKSVAARIERYWHDRGIQERGEPYVVTTRLKQHGFSAKMREAWYSVRTDMVNGYPKDYRTG